MAEDGKASKMILISIMEPSICRRCRFASETYIRDPEKGIVKHFRCLRGDCDNHIRRPSDPEVEIIDHED